MRVSTEKFYCFAKSALILLVLLTALSAGLHTVADTDMGWHLATGRWVVQHREIPHTDILSFTSAGSVWTYPPFAGVLLYLTYTAFGYAGLSWFCALACLAVVAILVRRRSFSSALLALLAIPAIAMRTAPRADLFSTVFFAVFLSELWAYQRGRNVRLWVLPVVMVFWVNLHPGFIAGLGVIGAYLLLESGDLLVPERRASVWPRLKRSLPWLGACIVATLLNPWGPRIYNVALGLMGANGSQEKINGAIAIAEFRCVPLSWHLLYQLIDLRHSQNGLSWLMLLAILLLGILCWKRRFGAGLIVALALYAGVTHARYIGLFAITVVTLGATAFDELFAVSHHAGTRGVKSSLREPLQVPAVTATLAAVALCAISVLHIADYVSDRTYVVFSPDLSFGAGESSWFPDRATAFIKREQLPGNVFEDYELGGYAAWSLGPKYPDFIDGRGNNPDLVMEQFKLYSEDPDSPAWQQEAERWKLNVLLVSTADFRGLQTMNPDQFCRSTTWRPVYMDDVSLVFLRNTPQNASMIGRLQIDCFTQALAAPASASDSALHQFYVHSSELFYTLHRDADARESLKLAAAYHTDDPKVHLLSALLFERAGQYAAAEQEYRESLAIAENGGVWYSLGRLYGSQGRSAEALHALKQAAGLSMQPFNIYMTMGKLQLVLNNPQGALDSFAAAEKSSPYRNSESLAPEIYAQLAEGRSEAHRQLANWNDAIAFQIQAIQRTPSAVRRWDRLARLYQASGQMGLAEEARQHVLQLQPSENLAPAAGSK
jgi:tetratricopeptide (TPR) repeat protein